MGSLNEIETMKLIDDSLSQIADEATKTRILRWAWSKHTKDTQLIIDGMVDDKTKRKRKEKKEKVKTSGKKQKISLSIIKNLNISPKDKKSFVDFIKEKQPISDQEKCVTAIYHMQHNLELKNVDTNHVYTCYKIIKWRVPADLENTLRVTASQKGWLDTSNLKDIKTTTHGDNLVEHDLPKTIRAK